MEDVEVKEKVSEQPKPKKKVTRIGVVINTPKLRVRQAASLEAEILMIIDKGTEVTILGPSKDFYKVSVNDVTGFCLKEYIEVKGE